MEARVKHATDAVLIAAGILLGLGLVGFVDGILHQILQWHHMLSSVRPAHTVSDLELNMVWDGLFDASTWVLTVVGLVLLWRAGQRDDVPWSSKTFPSLPHWWGVIQFGRRTD